MVTIYGFVNPFCILFQPLSHLLAEIVTASNAGPSTPELKAEELNSELFRKQHPS